MYTANTMATAIEALGMPYSSSSPADSQEKRDECARAGEGRAPGAGSQTAGHHDEGRFENAIRMVMVTGGSPNAVLHLIAGVATLHSAGSSSKDGWMISSAFPTKPHS